MPTMKFETEIGARSRILIFPFSQKRSLFYGTVRPYHYNKLCTYANVNHHCRLKVLHYTIIEHCQKKTHSQVAPF